MLPRTKEEALRQMRFIWFSFIVSIPLYIWTGETIQGPSWLTFPNAGTVFIIIGVLNLLSLSWAWRKRYSPALEAIRSQPENIDVVRRWNNSWTIVICNADAMTVVGLAFRLGGKTLLQSLTFYVVGALSVLWLWPREVWSSKNQRSRGSAK